MYTASATDKRMSTQRWSSRKVAGSIPDGVIGIFH